ncbi:MAG: PAS domain-containing protein, partial [Burkholderiales bacterium]|nr:PAS domain-containing protein [Burkholderiales bacterium]
SYEESLSSSLWVTSIRDLELQLNGILRLPDMQYAEVRTDQGALVAKAGQAISTHVIRHEFPLHFTHRQSQVNIGSVLIVANLEGVYQRLRDKVVVILITQTIKTFLVSLFILMLFQYMVGRHLKKIALFSDRLFAGSKAGNLQLERKTRPGIAGDELEQVVGALNAMQRRLDQFVEDLQESEFRWKFALEGAGDGVWDLNLVTNEVVYSRRWKEMLGYREDELPGTLDTYTRLAHPEDAARAFAQLDDNLAGKTDFFSIEQRMLCKDGSWKWVMSRGMVVEKNAEGKATRMIGTHTDISEQLNAAEEMRTLLVENEVARAELRLINDSMEKQVQERTAQREVDLSDLATTIAERIQEAQQGENEQRQYNFVISPGLHAWGDKRLLEVVLTNLLENAAKFSKMKELPQITFGCVQITEPLSQAAVQAFYVKDNGAGFDMRYAHKLFGVFQRLHKASEFSGTGIGLATVQRIVFRHGGHIWADSAQGEGATFYFTLKEFQ